MHRDMLPRIFEKDGVVHVTGYCGSGVVWAQCIDMRAAHKLMGHGEQARTEFDSRPPAATPLYRGDPWSYRHQSGLWIAAPRGLVARQPVRAEAVVQYQSVASTIAARTRLQGNPANALRLNARPSARTSGRPTRLWWTAFLLSSERAFHKQTAVPSGYQHIHREWCGRRADHGQPAIGQSNAICAIWGMPRNCVKRTIPLV